MRSERSALNADAWLEYRRRVCPVNPGCTPPFPGTDLWDAWFSAIPILLRGHTTVQHALNRSPTKALKAKYLKQYKIKVGAWWLLLYAFTQTMRFLSHSWRNEHIIAVSIRHRTVSSLRNIFRIYWQSQVTLQNKNCNLQARTKKPRNFIILVLLIGLQNQERSSKASGALPPAQAGAAARSGGQ